MRRQQQPSTSQLRQLRDHALRMENLAADAQQRLHAGTLQLQQVRVVDRAAFRLSAAAGM
jgi:hypothetical protein